MGEREGGRERKEERECVLTIREGRERPGGKERERERERE